MHPLGIGSEVYLLYLLGLFPALALRSAKQFNAPPPKEGDPPRRPLPALSRMFAGTLVMLALLFTLAWFTAASFGYPIFAVPPVGPREILAGIAALACACGLVFAGRAMRTADEIRDMPVNRLMPSTGQEKALYAAVAIAAGISEEAAYRGVLTAILWYWLGNQWLAALVSAAAFGAAHALQGWKSMALIFLIGLLMQCLVWYTGTLVIAMVVHAAYDLLAPSIRQRINRAAARTSIAN